MLRYDTTKGGFLKPNEKILINGTNGLGALQCSVDWRDRDKQTPA